MRDTIRIEIAVTRGDSRASAKVTRPINWSGDRRRHRKQVADVSAEITKTVVEALNLQEDSDG